ncbi:Glycosyltransferase involved in cell wall bisynthesis [Lachnospiraceae bacterium G41]|nr:Glycosyltransferase involved in cell wall bisynthesis [Lachnospiraceae bacterium G41]
MLIGIDLLWVRPGINGGTESATRNLINGFGMFDDKNEYILFVGKDTAESFEEYKKYPNMKIEICDTESLKRVKRIAWENLNLDKLARSLNVDVMFIPVYSKPNSLSVKKGGIPYITMIYDLQALHFPQYFSKSRLLFFKRSWKKACNTSVKLITSSSYSKEDIEEHFPSSKGKISVIYSPITVTNISEDNFDSKEGLQTESVLAKYGIEKDRYFYTLSSMLPHKNLETLIKTIKLLKESDDTKLVVSGVGGNKESFNSCVKEEGVENLIIDTGFVSDEERDILYENCKLFLFPSTFEGYGMPPIEAMMKGARVVTTKCTCIEEITQGKATYVDDPLNTNEWADAIDKALLLERKKFDFPEYDLKNVTLKYLDVFNGIKEK